MTGSEAAHTPKQAREAGDGGRVPRLARTAGGPMADTRRTEYPAPRRRATLVLAEAGLAGLLLWGLLLLLPFGYLAPPPADREAWLYAALAVPLGALALGLARRSGLWLVAAFPLTLLAAPLGWPALCGPRIYGVGPFIAVGAAFVLYLERCLALLRPDGDFARGTAPRGPRLAWWGVAAALVGSAALLAIWAGFPHVAGAAARARTGAAREGARVFAAAVAVAVWTFAAFRYGGALAGLLGRRRGGSRPVGDALPRPAGSPPNDVAGLGPPRPLPPGGPT